MYYSYPDVTVVCGEPQLEDEHQDNLLNPIVIFEVLSPSTERHDRASKFESYRRIEALREYVLIAQDGYRVEQYRRQEDTTWIFSEKLGLTDVLKLPAIGCELRLTDIYSQVQF